MKPIVFRSSAEFSHLIAGLPTRRVGQHVPNESLIFARSLYVFLSGCSRFKLLNNLQFLVGGGGNVLHTPNPQSRGPGCSFFWGGHCISRPSLWSSGQSSWVRFPALPDFSRSSGSGTGSTRPREYN
jgi:hypothetical protein